MCAYEIDLSFLLSDWYLPANDLAQIFKMLNFTDITPSVIEACNEELYIAVQAVRDLPSELLFPYFADSSPFLVEHFQDWWLGGVEDNSIWTKICWPYAIDWFSNHSKWQNCLVEGPLPNSSKPSFDSFKKIIANADKQSTINFFKTISKMPKNFQVLKERTKDGSVIFRRKELGKIKLNSKTELY